YILLAWFSSAWARVTLCEAKWDAVSAVSLLARIPCAWSWPPRLGRKCYPALNQAILLIRIGLLPEVLAAEIKLGVGLHGAVAVDGNLAGQAHFILVADGGKHAGQGEPLDRPLGTEVLHALLDEELA